MAKPALVVITGLPTAGKTALTIQLSQKINGEILTADGPRLIKQIHILNRMGTLQPKLRLSRTVDGFNFFPPEKYAKAAYEEIMKVTKRKKTPIIVGGAMSNISCLLSDRYVWIERISWKIEIV